MQLYNQPIHPTRRQALSAIRSSTRTHTHPPNHPPTPTHAIAIINQTDTSLHYINTPLKANQTVTPTKPFHNLSIKQTNKNKRTSRLGDLRLGLPPSRGPPSQWHPSWRHRLGGIRLRTIRLENIRLSAIRLGDIRLRVIRLGDIRLRAIRLGVIRLRVIRLGDIRLRVLRLGDIRLRAIRLGVIRLRVIRLGAIRLGDVRLRDCEGENGWHRRISPRWKGIKTKGPPVLPFHLRDIRLRLRPVPAVSGTSLSVFRLGDSLQFNTSKYT